MTRSRLAFLLLSCALLLPLAGGSLLRATDGLGTTEEDSLYKFLSVFSEVLGLVRHSYVEPTETEALLAAALDGTTDALDPFAQFVPAAEVPAFLAAREIGAARSGLVLARERGVAFVLGVEEGSPAAVAEVKAGDLLAKIDGESTRTMGLWKIQELLAAAPGTRRELELLRRGEPKKATLELASWAAMAPRLEERRGVAVLRIPRFDAATAPAVATLLSKISESQKTALLIDLHGVAGGVVAAGYAVAGLFVRGELGSLKARDEVIDRYRSDAEPRWRGALAVAVDGATVGPAEVLASVLRAAAGAKLVGQPTFGWAGRQELVELDGGARPLLTSAFYAPPDGALLRESVTPDLEVNESSRSFLEKDRSIDELILDRGVRLLLGEESLPEKKQAA